MSRIAAALIDRQTGRPRGVIESRRSSHRARSLLPVTLLLSVGLASLAHAQEPSPSSEATPPIRTEPLNILLILADDSAVDNYGCYGSTYFPTPRLDALARDGIRFTHCYSAPVCTPSRVELMTGREGIRNYVAFGTLDREEVTFGTMLQQAGYATAVAGKWQLHGGPNGSLAADCGFDTHCLWNAPGTKRARYWNPSLLRDGQLLETAPQDYGPDLFTDFLIEFLEKNKERPFFAYYPMALTHAPFRPTPLSAPRTEEEQADKQAAALRHFRDMTAYADRCVGRLVDALEKHGLRERTVVIYTTDNGTDRSLTYPFGNETRKGEKAYPTTGGTHAPLIVNCPGIVPAGQVCDDLVDFSDFLPTLADITQAELPDVPLDGRSFWAQCQGKEGDPRLWIYQYYYPKFAKAAEKHGQGVNRREIVWTQNHDFKLYRDGTLYALSDRDELRPIPNGSDEKADAARKLLQSALDSFPERAAKLRQPDR